tara:strand:+ start:38 stop:388 length:351 start_codon:yes stop_codon:yes gene_type:complete
MLDEKITRSVLYQEDVAKVFGVHVKTFRKNLDIIISNNPNNPRIQRYLGKKWFLASKDLDEFLGLFSKKKQSANKFNQLDHNAIEEKKTDDAQLELEAEYAADYWLEMQSEIARGK